MVAIKPATDGEIDKPKPTIEQRAGRLSKILMKIFFAWLVFMVTVFIVIYYAQLIRAAYPVIKFEIEQRGVYTPTAQEEDA